MRRTPISIAPVCLMLLLSAVARAQIKPSPEQDIRIADAVLAAPEALRGGAAVIERDASGTPLVLREGTNALVCEADRPTPGFAVECYHKSFQGVMDWIYERIGAGARSFEDMFVNGPPQVEVNPGAMQYGLIGATREEAVRKVSIHLPYATSGSTGLPNEERTDGPWLMWGGTRAAHVMFGERPEGIPAEYPTR